MSPLLSVSLGAPLDATRIWRHNMVLRAPFSTSVSSSSYSSSWKQQQDDYMNGSLFQQQSKALLSTASPRSSEEREQAVTKSSSTDQMIPKSSSPKRPRVATIPTPKSSPSSLSIRQSIEAIDPQAILTTALQYSWNMTKTVLKFLWHLPYNMYFYATHTQERQDKIAEIKEHAKKEFDHYKVGTKVRTS